MAYYFKIGRFYYCLENIENEDITEIEKSDMYKKEKYGCAAKAQWIHLRLPYYLPGLKSRAQHF